jgi:uncharacterized OB-fold protein
MTSASQYARPLAAGLLTEETEPRLIGGRHRTSGRIVFPCPQGSEGADYDAVPLSRTGTLWSWTVQRFPPKSPPYAGPATFEPFAVGYVELPGEAIVETRLTDVAFEALAVGLPMRLTVIPFTTSEDGTIITTYAFRPDRERMS